MPFDGDHVKNLEIVVLQNAKSLLQSGWCQHHFKEDLGDGRERFCAVGAYQQAYINDNPEIPVDTARARADELVRNILCKQVPFYFRLMNYTLSKEDSWHLLTWYNDSRWRTQRSIIKLYDHAIETQLYR